MRNLIVLLLLMVSAISIVSADDAVKPAVAPYKVAAGDVIDVVVQDHTDLSKTATILPDGTLTYPYLGEITVAGLTLKQVTERFTAALAKQIVNPMVQVTIKTLHELDSKQVTVLGAVKTPGKHTLKEGWRVLDLVIDCGGLAAEPKTLTAQLIRDGVESIKIDLQKVMTGMETPENRPLRANDLLIFNQVEAAKLEAQVLGEVGKPGYITITRDGSLTSVLNLVGGVTPKAALSKATITRDGKVIPVDLRPLVLDGKPLEGITVQPGDTLFVPQNRAVFGVYGAVARPGLQMYPDDKPLTILSALSLAGGQSGDANMKTVSLVHPSRDGKATIVPLNIEQMLKKGDLTKDLPVLPGDIVYIAAKSQKRTGAGLLDILTFIPILNLLHIPI